MGWRSPGAEEKGVRRTFEGFQMWVRDAMEIL